MSANTDKLLYSLCLAVFSFPSAILANDGLLTEEDLFHSLPSVSSATGLKQQLNKTPIAITIIDRHMIEASGAVHIADLLRLVPGFQVYQVNENKFGVVNHGQGRDYLNRMEVMIDGRSVYTALFSTVDWSALGITLDDIDHIEVVRGTNVQTQGSNAFMGAIDIITREPLGALADRFSTTHGSLNSHNYSVQHSGTLGSMDYWVSSNSRRNDGHDIGYDRGDSSKPAKSMDDGGHMAEFSFRSTYTPTLADSIDLQFGVSKGTIGSGESDTPDEIIDRNVYTHYQSLIWQRSLDSARSLKVHAYHNYLAYNQTALNYYPAGISSLNALFPGYEAFTLDLGAEKGETHRYDLDVELTHNLKPGTRLIWNTGVRNESLNSWPLLHDGDNYQSEMLYRLSGNLEHQFSDQWTLNAGAMAEYTDLTGLHISPRAALNYHFNPEHSLRVGLARAYRTPSLLEFYQATAIDLPDNPTFNGITYNQVSLPNLDLKPEEITSFELGYLWQTMDSRWAFDTRLFMERIKDGIDHYHVPYTEELGYSDRVRSYDNIAGWQTHGFEVQLKFRPHKKTWLHLAYAYAHTQGRYNKGEGYTDSDTILDKSTPQNTLALLASHELTDGLNLSLGYYAMSSVQWLGAYALDGYDRLDLRLAKRFEQAQVELIWQNLSSDYLEFNYNNTFDNRFFLRFNWDFQ